MGRNGTPTQEGRDAQRRVQVMRLARAIRHMLATLDSPFDLDSTAGVATLSRYHFVRQFRGLTGESPQRFHLRLRLQRAAWSLTSGDEPVTGIALAAGFGSVDSFARAFHRIYDVTPTSFRRLGADPWSNFSRFGFWRPTPPTSSTGANAMLEIRQLPAMIYAAVRNVGPYNTVGPSFERIVGWAAKSGLMKPDTKVLGLSWDNPFEVPAEKLRYDAAITIDRRIETPDDIHIAALPAMAWAMTTHKGSYARMTATFMDLGREMGLRKDLIHVPLCGLEIYLSGPDTPEQDLRTDLGMPVVQIG